MIQERTIVSHLSLPLDTRRHVAATLVFEEL